MFFKIFFASIIISLNINAQIIIKNIIIVENWKTDESIIKKNCAFSEGEELTKDIINGRVETTKQNLVNTFYFDNVNVTPLYDSLETHVDIIIQVTEAAFPYRISGGNLFVKLDFLNTTGKFEEKGFSGGTNIIEYNQSRKWINETSFGYKFKSGWNKYSKIELRNLLSEKVNFSRWYADAQIDYFLTRRLIVSGLLGYEYSIPYGIKSQEILNNYNLQKYHDLFFTLGFIFDNRNSVQYPSEGQYLELNAERGMNLTGSHSVYETYSLDLRQYYPVTSDISVFARVYSGVVLNDPPYTKLLWNNNIQKIRIKGLDLYNGYKTILFTGELRNNTLKTNFLFGTWLESLFFVDIGNVWSKSENISLDNLNIGYGPGLRIHIPRPVFVDINLIFSIGKKNGFFFGVAQNL